MENMRRQLLGMTIEEMKLFAAELGEKPFRGGADIRLAASGSDGFRRDDESVKGLKGKTDGRP